MAKLKDMLVKRESWSDLIMGNYAVARAMIDTGTRVITTFPGSPTPEIAAALDSVDRDNYPGERGIIMLNVRIATPPREALHARPGIASSYIFGLEPGDEVTICGPYGNFFARDTDAEMCFVAGGAGMAPMRSHIFDQFRRRKTRRKVTFWYGARSLSDVFYVDELDSLI